MFSFLKTWEVEVFGSNARIDKQSYGHGCITEVDGTNPTICFFLLFLSSKLCVFIQVPKGGTTLILSK